MTLNNRVAVKDGSTWKYPLQVSVNDGGTWKDVRQVWVKKGGVWQCATPYIYLDGVTDYVNMKENYNTNQSTLHFEIEFFQMEQGVTSYLFDSGGNTQYRWRCYISGSTNTIEFKVVQAGVERVALSSGIVPKINQRHNLVITRTSNSAWTMKLDGVTRDTASSGYDQASSVGDTLIGNSYTKTTTASFKGDVYYFYLRGEANNTGSEKRFKSDLVLDTDGGTTLINRETTNKGANALCVGCKVNRTN